MEPDEEEKGVEPWRPPSSPRPLILCIGAMTASLRSSSPRRRHSGSAPPRLHPTTLALRPSPRQLEVVLLGGSVHLTDDPDGSDCSTATPLHC
ncbi:hypothetical protein GUJ93_ZPchr0010g8730 [Zizania palustris]|uniref:Uncharacterized protein n=1 Tax=Zizania palustris TaxID=103762 RepID=A0A8J5WH76_ZIZPA|nr:hypothetical protein GUJ93_ZPchr0010g8730 [Zizania palustris]